MIGQYFVGAGSKTALIRDIRNHTMDIIVNGKDEVIEAGVSVGDYLKSKDLAFDKVVVEYNRAIIDQVDYETIELKDKDILEILRFVGGG